MPQERDNNFSPEQGKEPSTKWRDRIVIFLLLVGFLVSLIYFLWLFLQNPSIGVIRVGTPPAKDESFEQGKELKRFVGEYVSFSYPGTYVEKTHTLPVEGPIKESIFLSDAGMESKKIAVTIEKRAEESLEASPSYQMRMNDSKTYRRTSIDLNGFSGFLFTKDSQVFEQMVFFRKNGFILSIAVTSPFSLDTLWEGLENILKSFEQKT